VFLYICSFFLPNFSLGVLNPHVLVCGLLLYYRKNRINICRLNFFRKNKHESSCGRCLRYLINSLEFFSCTLLTSSVYTGFLEKGITFRRANFGDYEIFVIYRQCKTKYSKRRVTVISFIKFLCSSYASKMYSI